MKLKVELESNPNSKFGLLIELILKLAIYPYCEPSRPMYPYASLFHEALFFHTL